MQNKKEIEAWVDFCEGIVKERAERMAKYETVKECLELYKRLLEHRKIDMNFYEFATKMTEDESFNDTITLIDQYLFDKEES